MRVLQIDKFLDRGGVGRYIRTLGGLLADRGWEVLEFGCGRPGAAGPRDRPGYHDFTAGSGPAALGRMIYNAEAAELLEGFLRAHPVDVAHLHNIYHHLTPSILPVLARHGVGVVMTVHDFRLVCPTKHCVRSDGLCTRCVTGGLWHAASGKCAGPAGLGLAVETFVQRFARRYARWVDAFVCPCRWLAGALRKAGLPRRKVHVAPNPVEFYDPAPGAGEALLYVGRMSPEKGPARMLDLAGVFPSVPVVLAGDGPELPELTARAEDRGLGNVRFAGQVSAEQLGGLYGEAAAVVVPSVCLENSPAAMLEAMAAGRCAVVPDQPTLAEWVSDGRTGRVFRTGDDGDLARVCDAVLRHGEARQRMAEAGRRLLRERHDPGRVVGAVEALYEQAVRRCAWR